MVEGTRQRVLFWYILLLCLGVCFQMPGVPGSMFDYADSDDDVFHASILLGCAITSSSSILQPWLTCSSGSIDTPLSFDYLRAYVLFHPPPSLFPAV